MRTERNLCMSSDAPPQGWAASVRALSILVMPRSAETLFAAARRRCRPREPGQLARMGWRRRAAAPRGAPRERCAAARLAGGRASN